MPPHREKKANIANAPKNVCHAVFSSGRSQRPTFRPQMIKYAKPKTAPKAKKADDEKKETK